MPYRGPLPGYYWDKGKEKYFALVPGHDPSNSQYTKAQQQWDTHVAQQNRERDAYQAKLNAQRVQRPSILQTASFATSSLLREIGSSTVRSHQNDAVESIVENFRRFNPLRPTHVTMCGAMHIISARMSPQDGRILYERSARRGRQIASCAWDQHDLSNTFVKGSEHLMTRKHEYDEPAQFWPVDRPRYGVYIREDLTPGEDHELVIASDNEVVTKSTVLSDFGNVRSFAISKGGNIGVGLEDGLGCKRNVFSSEDDTLTETLSEDDTYTEAHSTSDWAEIVEWLGEWTLAASQRRNLLLWDPRTDDSGRRLTMANNITGIKAMPTNESQLLVSDNYSIKLCDLRMVRMINKKIPVDRFPVVMPGKHEGTKLHLDVSSQGMIVACHDDKVRLISSTTGRRLENDLPLHEDPSKTPDEVRLTQLSWAEDAYGTPYVFACSKLGLHRWAASRTTDEDDLM